MPEDSIMKFERTLPRDFNGTFEFTNWSDEDFVGKWGGKEYHYPRNASSLMIIPEHSPLEIQNIRKKFAKDLAEREFFRGQEYKKLMNQERSPEGVPKLNGIHSAGTYTLSDLVGYIQRCLEPLPIVKATVLEAQKEKLEEKLSRNEEGELNTEILDKKTSLREKALRA